MCFTIGFLTFDLLNLLYCVEATDTRIHKQTLMHHYAAIAGFSTTLVTGFSYPGVGCMSLYSEISSIFL